MTVSVVAVGCADTPSVAENDENADNDDNDDNGDNGDNGDNDNDSDCPNDDQACGSECVNLEVDVEHCGECDAECESKPNAEVECVEGQCTWSCDPGWIDENGDLDEPGGGCETECEETNGGVSQCDGRDNNCDGTIDTGFDVGEECVNDDGACDNTGETVCTDDGTGVECGAEPLDEQTWYEDADGDGYGNPDETTTACEQPEGYVANDEDCDDTDPEVNPDADPMCDGRDTNCDGTVDTGFDVGEECVNDEGECDNTGETVCSDDGSGVECGAEPLDEQTWYEDADGDGYGNPDESTTACEQPDGYVANDEDCDDTDPEVYPGAGPRCDGKDTNCDGTVDHMISEGPGSTISLASASMSSQYTGYPPTAMGSDFDGDDGFCLAAYDEDLERIAIVEIDHDGDSTIALSDQDFADSRLLDVETRDGMCTVLVSDESGGTPGDLYALRYNAGDIFGVNRVTTNLYVRDSEHTGASVYGRDDTDDEAWAVVYARNIPGSGETSILYRALPEFYGDDTEPTEDAVMNSGLNNVRDVEVGPSPVGSDQFLVVWRHTGTPGFTASGIYADRWTSDDEFSRVEGWNALDDDYGNSVLPMVTELDDELGSTYLRGLWESDNSDFWFEEMLWSFVDEEGSLGDDAFIDTEQDASYIGRQPIVDTAAEDLWWFVDTRTNTNYEVDHSTTGFYGTDEFTDPNVDDDDELLAASEAETGLSVLRMTDDDPFTFEVNQISCY